MRELPGSFLETGEPCCSPLEVDNLLGSPPETGELLGLSLETGELFCSSLDSKEQPCLSLEVRELSGSFLENGEPFCCSSLKTGELPCSSRELVLGSESSIQLVLCLSLFLKLKTHVGPSWNNKALPGSFLKVGELLGSPLVTGDLVCSSLLKKGFDPSLKLPSNPNSSQQLLFLWYLHKY